MYTQISQNQIKTFLIIGIFIFIVSGFFFIVGTFVDSPQEYFVIGAIVSVLSAAGSYFYSDKIVLFTTGAKLADKKTYFDLYTVTENLSIADGIAMPRLYVIHDPAPNAFATGRNEKNAVVAVSTGLLERLNRSELEGVIGHELSHVKNRDILLSTIVAVLVGTVGYVAEWIMRSMWWGRTSDNEDRRTGRNPIFFLLFVVVLVITPIIATLIQLAVSRRREFLADASGTLLTRNPEALASALEKISSDPHLLKTANASTAHMFISNPFNKSGRSVNWITSLFSTHPPIAERIKILRSM